MGSVAELNADVDKTIKLNSFCGICTWKPALIQAMPGDVFLCHNRTIHGVTPNYEADRSIAYLRIRVKKEYAKVAPLRLWTESVLFHEPFALFAVAGDSCAAEESLRDDDGQSKS